MITIQYEQTIARRGQLTTTIKERGFKTEEAMAKWADREQNAGRIGQILRYSTEKE